MNDDLIMTMADIDTNFAGSSRIYEIMDAYAEPLDSVVALLFAEYGVANAKGHPTLEDFVAEITPETTLDEVDDLIEAGF